MKNLLIISYFFAPLNSTGSLRILRFIKYLPLYGWNVTILTGDWRKGKNFFPLDREFYKEIPEGVKILRTPLFDFKYFYRKLITLVKSPYKKDKNIYTKSKLKKFKTFIFNWLFPDYCFPWILLAIFKAYREIKKRKIDIIFATAPPWTDFFVGYILSKLTGKRLVLDYRDIWTFSKISGLPTFLHKWLARNLEKKIIKRSSWVIGVTQPIINSFKKISPEFKEKFVFIPNGFVKEWVKSYSEEKRDKLRIIYAGTLYKKRSPKTFLQGLNLLLKEKPDIRKNIEIIFIGADYEGELKKWIKICELEDIVSYKGYFSIRDARKLMAYSDILLLLISPEYREELTGKIFEYIQAGKPILGIVPNGEASRFIQEAKIGFVADINDPVNIKTILKEIYEIWKRNEIMNVYKPDWDFMKSYEANFLTKNLVEILESIEKVG